MLATNENRIDPFCPPPYTWGTDLSGSMQGAGGVGGILSAKDGSSVYHYTYDANGNVSEVLNSSGGIAAHYEYDAFGNMVASSGTYATVNAYRFSTKPIDSESGLYYYGFRYYNPSTGRWPSRDPMGEAGGVNIYSFTLNDLIGNIDWLGLWTKDGVLKLLCCKSGAWVVAKLNSMSVFEFTKIVRKWKIYEKKSDGGKGRFLRNDEYEVNGLAGDAIWIRKDLSDEEAAATLFHEADHTNQPEDMPLLDREVESWTKEQEFRQRHNISITPPEWVNKDGSLNKNKIENDVKDMYKHRDPNSSEIYEFAGQDTQGKNQVSGWKCSTISPTP